MDGIEPAEIVATAGEAPIRRLVAPNPGPMTLAGTNVYVVGTSPSWVIDPGPADRGHLAALETLLGGLGDPGGLLLTHSHLDHSEAVGELELELVWGSGRGSDEAADLMAAAAHTGVEPVHRRPEEPEQRAGPFRVIPTPGHAADHVAFVLEDVCFCGDLILGEGSSIVPPRAGGGSVADYMASLERIDALAPRLLLPGHGPPIDDPAAKIAEYREHRLQREAALLAALEHGERSRRRLLGEAWDDVPEQLLPAAALAMQAHLEKLAADGVELSGLTD